MKTTLALTAALMLLAVSTGIGQSDVIIKKHALEIRDQNNVRQGVTPPSQPTQPAAQPATRPAMQPATTTANPTPVQQALARVRADLAAIQANSQVTPEQKQQLAKDLLATAQSANKPTAATVAALANDLSAAFAQKPLPETDCNRLLTDLAAVLNPANIQSAQMQAIFADIQAIFQVNGLSRKDAMRIADDAKAIAAETKR